MDFYYSDDDDRMEDIVSDEGDEQELPDSDVSRRQKTYRILKEEDIKQLQEEDISDVCNVLSVSRSVACTLLCQNNWMPSYVYDKWFERPVVVNSEKQVGSICNICYETTRTSDGMDTSLSAACGHLFCADCWETYISMSIEDGPGCLTLKCPEPGCESHPGLDMVDSVSSPDDKHKYYQYLNRSYIESNPKRKWCPAPGCDFAIEFDDGSQGEGFDVACGCGYRFCWSCGDESHSPLDCDTVAKWMEKNMSEAENTTWIIAYTKPCPKCRRAIEKNQGCNHMTCGAPCRFNFCWLCLQPMNHPNGPCNSYKEGINSNQKLAKEHLERYTHYYERWDANDKSRKKALADLNTAKDEHVDWLITKQGQTQGQTKFVVEAWEQIAECRRVLKWSYAYGYYRLSRLSGRAKGKLDFFEHLQWKGESALEKLHHCAEKEMNKYLLADGPCKDFNEFREKLVGLTSVTKNYFENLVRALENNLSEFKIVGDEESFTAQELAFIAEGDEEAYNAEGDEEAYNAEGDEEAYIAEDFYFNFK